MNQYSVTFLISFLNEVVNFLCHLIMVIEDKLSSVNLLYELLCLLLRTLSPESYQSQSILAYLRRILVPKK